MDRNRKMLVITGIGSAVVLALMILIVLCSSSKHTTTDELSPSPGNCCPFYYGSHLLISPILIFLAFNPFLVKIFDAGDSIYFGTHSDGIYACSEATDSVGHFRNTAEDVEGVAYDPRSDMLYYSTIDAIHRVGMDGTTGAGIVFRLWQSPCKSVL